MAARRFWRIQVERDSTKIFEHKVNADRISEDGIRNVVQVLAAKYGLNDLEIIEYFTERHNNLLDVRVSSAGRRTLDCGHSVQVTAGIFDE